MGTTVRLEWMPDSPVEYKSDGIYITAAEVRDVLTSSHIHCCWEVRRGGELQPCGKEAVAIRFDENNGGLGEVCKHHAKRMLVPLAFIAHVAGARPDKRTLTPGPPDYWCHRCGRGAEGCRHTPAEQASIHTRQEADHAE